MTPRKSIDKKDERGVTVLRDTTLTFPELFMEVWVEGDASEQRAFAEMFIRARCTKADSPDTADLVVFTGGADVDPQLYGEVKHATTYFSTARDNRDMTLYSECLEKGIPMFGVCRGSQFLHVMNGGKLYQEVDGHTGDHPIYDIKKKQHIQRVSSVHHQMVIANRSLGMEVIADTHKAKVRWKNPTDKVIGQMSDVEAFFYPDTCCFGVQGHPEYKGYHQFLKWTLETIDELICQNPDLTQVGRNRRLKPEIITQRDVMTRDKLKELN